MTLGDRQEIFSSNISRLINYAVSNGYGCRLREVQRTKEQQEIYIAQGKSKTPNSAHLNSLAADIYFTKDSKILGEIEELTELGTYWESLHEQNEWGGNWKTFPDAPHFEMRK